MKPQTYTIFIAIMVVVFGLSPLKAQITTTDTFGSGANTFTIDFVNIGNAGNSADPTTGYGAVPYQYRVGTYEITQDAIDKATNLGLTNVVAGAWSGSKPAAMVSWYEAAAFVNWLNTTTGKQAAYNLTFSGSWSMTLWSSADAWTAGGENLYRHKDAFYFLPSENEWYKSAYFNPAGSNYYLYPTGSETAPSPVASGTAAGTAVYIQTFATGPADVNLSGGLSPYGTMGQGGNVWEWSESANGGSNNLSSVGRAVRGGDWDDSENIFRSTFRLNVDPAGVADFVGYRVASVPEPSTYALLLIAGAGAIGLARRR